MDKTKRFEKKKQGNNRCNNNNLDFGKTLAYASWEKIARKRRTFRMKNKEKGINKTRKALNKVRINGISEIKRKDQRNNSSGRNNKDFDNKLGHMTRVKNSAAQVKTKTVGNHRFLNYRDKMERGDIKFHKEKIRKHGQVSLYKFSRTKITVLCTVLIWILSWYFGVDFQE